MSLIKTVVGLIEEHGTLSTFELIQFVHTHSRKQVIRAVQNASRLGYVRCIGLTDRNGKAQGAGIWSVVTKPADQGRPARRPANSVWDYAQR